jgi:hypothetical protein
MLRISLFGPPKHRQQPERYVQYALKFVGNIKKLSKKGLSKTKKLAILYKIGLLI